MTPKTRPLSEQEKLSLKELGREPRQTAMPSIIGLGGWGLTVNLGIWIDSQFHFMEAMGAPTFFGLTTVFWLVVGISVSRSWPKPGNTFGGQCQKDLDGGVANIFSFSAKEAILVEEFTDEGSQYFIRLQDDSVLFLRGQYLYASEARKEFPSTEFEITQSPHTKIVFEIICRGTYLAPTKELKPFRAEHFEKDKIPQDMELLTIPWTEIETKYS